jgi:hypothetical protein
LRIIVPFQGGYAGKFPEQLCANLRRPTALIKYAVQNNQWT